MCSIRLCIVFVLVLATFGARSYQANQVDEDPISEFCRCFAHQTTVIDRKLYIDGGPVNYGDKFDQDTINLTSKGQYICFKQHR